MFALYLAHVSALSVQRLPDAASVGPCAAAVATAATAGSAPAARRLRHAACPACERHRDADRRCARLGRPVPAGDGGAARRAGGWAWRRRSIGACRLRGLHARQRRTSRPRAPGGTRFVARGHRGGKRRPRRPARHFRLPATGQSRTARYDAGLNGARAQPRLVARARQTRPGGPAPGVPVGAACPLAPTGPAGGAETEGNKP